MTDTAKWYYKGVEHILAGDAKWPASSASIRMALFTTFAPTQSTDEYYTAGSLPAGCTQVSGGGYTQGGTTLTSVAFPAVYSTTNIKLASADATWTGAMTFTGVMGAAIYYAGTSNFLLGYIWWATTGPKAAQGGNFTVPCPTGGWFENAIT
jgi:hypothetical protein